MLKLQVQTECLNNSIFIIDGLKDDDLQTANRLYDDISVHAKHSEISIHYGKVSTREELFKVLNEIKEYSKAGGYPIIHFELHGSKKEGACVGNGGENISWRDLVDVLRDINVITRNNLGIVMAGCHGLYALTEIDGQKPTPFNFFMGCEDSIQAGVLQDNIAKFYHNLFENYSLPEAMKAVKSEFVGFLAEKVFVESMVKYLRNQARGKGKNKRIENIVTKWVKLHPDHTKEELKKFRFDLKARLKPSIEEIQRNADIFLHGRYFVNPDDILTYLETFKGPSMARK
ncbi:MAG: hypothetical protein ACYDAI_12370 [Trichloromonadaceae bacterium]